MNSYRDSFMEIIEDVLYKNPNKDLREISSQVIDFLTSDEARFALIKNISVPSDVELKRADLKLNRSPANRARKSRERLELIEDISSLKYRLNSWVQDGINQLLPHSSTIPTSGSTFLSYNLQSTPRVSSFLDNFKITDPHVNLNNSESEQKRLFVITKQLFNRCKATVDQGENIDSVDLKHLGDSLDYILGIPHFKKKLVDILQRDLALRKDKSSRVFLQQVLRSQKSNERKGYISKEERQINKIKNMLNQAIVSNTLNQTNRIVESYIEGKVSYDRYIEKILEASVYAGEKIETS